MDAKIKWKSAKWPEWDIVYYVGEDKSDNFGFSDFNVKHGEGQRLAELLNMFHAGLHLKKPGEKQWPKQT